jgi:hypothetical protein
MSCLLLKTFEGAMFRHTHQRPDTQPSMRRSATVSATSRSSRLTRSFAFNFVFTGTASDSIRVATILFGVAVTRYVTRENLCELHCTANVAAAFTILQGR